MRHPKLLDTVALLHSLPSEVLQFTDERCDLSAGLAAGTVGTVVEIFPQPARSASCLVEFSDTHGRGYTFATVPAEALLVLHYAPSESVAAQQ